MAHQISWAYNFNSEQPYAWKSQLWLKKKFKCNGGECAKKIKNNNNSVCGKSRTKRKKKKKTKKKLSIIAEVSSAK